MSPIALVLLEKAYSHYQKTFDRTFSYQCKNANDMFNSTEATCQLYEYGYIENVSDFVFEDSITNFFNPIVFTLTDRGIEYMRSNRKF